MAVYTADDIRARINALLTTTGFSAREVERRAKARGYDVTHSHVSHIAAGSAPYPGAEKLAAIAAGFGFEGIDAMMGSSPTPAPTTTDSDAGADRLTREEVERMIEERLARRDQIQRGEREPVIAQAADGTVLTPRKPPADAPQKTVRLLSDLAAGPADDVDYLAQAEGEIELPPDVSRVVSDEAVAYRVRGNSLSGLGIYDGMVVVAEPIDVRDGAEGRGYKSGDVVLALAWSGSEPARMYVKQFRSTGPFPPGLWSVLPPSGKGSESEVLHEWEYRVVARVVWAYMPAFRPGG